MKVVSLDLHAETTQMFVSDENGQVLLEMPVPTEPKQLRRVVSAIPGPKCVVFEEGPLSALIRDALGEVAQEVVSCDPAYNALIARDEDSDDERDARHLEKLFRLQAVRPVYIPPEPYLSLRSLLSHRLALQQSATAVKARIKALARRCGVATGGRRLYQRRQRREVLPEMASESMQWQIQSLWRVLDALGREVGQGERAVRRLTRGIPVVARLQQIPGVGPIVSATLVAWIADPWRFRNRNALTAYAGLGLGQGATNWQPVGPARASRRGNRQLKRVLFLAAVAAGRSRSALAFRYHARRAEGWDAARAQRDVARKILHIAWALWKKGGDYDDSLVNGKQIGGQR
ncbi:MAG: IS110 family transposase [Candidatus Brocadiia bacterium]